MSTEDNPWPLLHEEKNHLLPSQTQTHNRNSKMLIDLVMLHFPHSTRSCIPPNTCTSKSSCNSSCVVWLPSLWWMFFTQEFFSLPYHLCNSKIPQFILSYCTFKKHLTNIFHGHSTSHDRAFPNGMSSNIIHTTLFWGTTQEVAGRIGQIETYS